MHLIALALACGWSPAGAQSVLNGDTIRVDGRTYRLWGVDAPEAQQACHDGWRAGYQAGTRLQELIKGRTVRCEEKSRDADGRALARCEVSGVDLGAALVREGMAWAYGRYGTDYIEQEEAARKKGLGVHAHPCTPAWEWRARGRLQANNAPGLPS